MKKTYAITASTFESNKKLSYEKIKIMASHYNVFKDYYTIFTTNSKEEALKKYNELKENNKDYDYNCYFKNYYYQEIELQELDYLSDDPDDFTCDVLDHDYLNCKTEKELEEERKAEEQEEEEEE